MGGPDMAPHTPQRSSRPGKTGAGLGTREVSAARPAGPLLSGGPDSPTALAVARRDGFDCHALTIDYGQRHRVELDAARAVAARLGARDHVTIALDLRRFGGSALTDDIDVPKGRDVDAMTDIPV